MESKKEFNHPYWQIYSRLIALRKASRKQVNKELPELMELAQLRKKDRLFIHALMLLPWFNVKMVEEIFFLRLREFFAYSVLSPEILELIAQYAPLVELAAGNGYNAWLLEQMGVDVTAIDAFPVEEGKNWFFHTNVLGFPTGAGSSFTKVLKGDAEALVNYPNHALLLCWPPLNKMAANSLSHFSGKHIIFIGNKVVCANTAFYKELDTQWKLEKSIATGSFDTCHKEVLEVYCRK